MCESKQLSEWVDSYQHISTIRLYSAVHVDSCWKIQDNRQIKNTDNTETKHNPEKQTTQNTAKTKLPWFTRPGNNAPEPTQSTESEYKSQK